LCYQFSHTLSAGMENDEVVELQKTLMQNKWLSVDAPTGYFGAQTKSAVAALQKSEKLPVTGVVDLETRTFLNTCVPFLEPPPVVEAPEDPYDALNRAFIESLQVQMELLLHHIKKGK